MYVRQEAVILLRNTPSDDSKTLFVDSDGYWPELDGMISLAEEMRCWRGVKFWVLMERLIENDLNGLVDSRKREESLLVVF